MKKSLLLTLLVASLFAIGLTGCKDSVNPDAPVIDDFFITDTPYSEAILPDNSVDLSKLHRTTDIIVPASNDIEPKQKYTVIISFYDPNRDVNTWHESWDNFNEVHKKYGINHVYDNQVNRLENFYFYGKFPSTIDYSAYLTDSKGNKSKTKTLKLNMIPQD